VLRANGRTPRRRVLITGGAGFVGSHLADAVVARGDSVAILDDFSTGRRENVAHLLDSPLVDLVEGSTLDADLVDELVTWADVCLHLASAVGVQLVVSNPLESLLRNVRGTDIVLSAAVQHGKPVLFTSTSEVYGKKSDGALNEESDRILGSAYKARWAYAIAKSFGECLAYGLARDRSGQTITVRLFNTVGPRQTGAYGMVLPRFVRQALEGEQLTVFGTGRQTRCFAHVADVVGAILGVLDHSEASGKVLNIGASREITILELARRVIERADSSSTIRFVAYEEAYDDGFEELGRRKPDTTALRQLTGWVAKRTVDDAIDDVIAYERARAAGEGSALVGAAAMVGALTAPAPRDAAEPGGVPVGGPVPANGSHPVAG
jgi:nucleoside-diphosphate-sugar epimerase